MSKTYDYCWILYWVAQTSLFYITDIPLQDALTLMRLHCNVASFAMIRTAAKSKSNQYDGWWPRANLEIVAVILRSRMESLTREIGSYYESCDLKPVTYIRTHSLVADTPVSELLENSNPNLAGRRLCVILRWGNLSFIESRPRCVNKSRADVMSCGITEPSRVCLLINKINTPLTARVEISNRLYDISYVLSRFALSARIWRLF